MLSKSYILKRARSFFAPELGRAAFPKSEMEVIGAH
jgi:hypothetical protein